MAMDRMHHYPAAANGICHDPIETHNFLRWTLNNSNTVTDKALSDLNVFNLSHNVEQKVIADNVSISLRPLDSATVNKVETRSVLLTVDINMPVKEIQFDLKVKYKTRNGTWSENVYKRDKVQESQRLKKTLELVNPLRTEASESLAFHVILVFSNVHYEIKQDRGVVTGMTAVRGTAELYSNPLPMRSLPDYTKPNHHPMATLQLDVEKNMLYAFPDILACQSSVFAKKINRPDQVIQVDNRTYKEILLLLRLLHPATPERITAANANQVISMAGEYCVDHLLESAERVQCSALQANLHGADEALESFSLSRRYHRERLEVAAVRALGSVTTEMMQSETNFTSMDKDTQCALAMAKMQLYEQKK